MPWRRASALSAAHILTIFTTSGNNSELMDFEPNGRPGRRRQILRRSTSQQAFSSMTMTFSGSSMLLHNIVFRTANHLIRAVNAVNAYGRMAAHHSAQGTDSLYWFGTLQPSQHLPAVAPAGNASRRVEAGAGATRVFVALIRMNADHGTENYSRTTGMSRLVFASTFGSTKISSSEAARRTS
jgi:hypothetical protein